MVPFTDIVGFSDLQKKYKVQKQAVRACGKRAKQGN